jgi:hypothetical protein
MAEKSEIKITRTYSLDPDLVAWITQKAARLTIEKERRISDSEVANDILTAAMDKDLQQLPIPIPTKKNITRPEAVAA